MLTAATDWFTALSLCKASGGTLASINSLSENNAIANFVRSQGDIGYIWLGYRRISYGGPFVWVDGSTSTYTNWDAPEPNFHSGNEDVVEMYLVYRDGLWNDVNSNLRSSPGLCSAVNNGKLGCVVLASLLM